MPEQKIPVMRYRAVDSSFSEQYWPTMQIMVESIVISSRPENDPVDVFSALNKDDFGTDDSIDQTPGASKRTDTSLVIVLENPNHHQLSSI